jgi:hypothetical protein
MESACTLVEAEDRPIVLRYARVAGKVKLRLMQLAPLLDETSAKVKYGGSSAELKKKTIFEISRALQQLMPQAAFLRLPPYPGVVCQYHGGYGFVVVMTGGLYREGDRPRERFRAMKYFHLGHRLKEIVIREREFRANDKEQGSNHEATRSEQVD